MTARAVARRVLERVEKGAWATPALDGELARSQLDDRDRRLATELVYGVLRHQIRIDHALSAHASLARTPVRIKIALRVAAYQVLFLRVPGYAAVDDGVSAARKIGGIKLGGFANAVLRKLVAAGEDAARPAVPVPGPRSILDPLPGEPALPEGKAGIAIAASLPDWILDELAATVPADELVAAAAALSATPRLAGRANRRRADRATVIERLAAEGARAEPVADDAVPDAFFVDGLGDPAASPSFKAGLWTVQDPGAQAVVRLAAPEPGMRVLDACAGVGGKSTYLAELADGLVIDAADLSATKLELLTASARRLGDADAIHPIVCDLTARTAPLAAAYDLIILDAPCTGLGVLRRHPEAKYRLGPADVERMAQLQRDLVDALVTRLAPGGTMVYAVCSFTRREAEHPLAGVTTLAIDDVRRTWPHRSGADAFFAARLIQRCAV